ncbi:MAG: hypothetical protein WA634_07630 [Silvibacterium sp.]
MVNECANPKCAKPLHYLREGRIFVFDVVVGDGSESVHRMEHFWLCGTCSKTMRLDQTTQGVRAVMKSSMRMRQTVQKYDQPLAS